MLLLFVLSYCTILLIAVKTQRTEEEGVRITEPTIILKIVGRPSLVMGQPALPCFMALIKAKNLSQPLLMFFHHKQPQKNLKRENPRGFRDKLPIPNYSQNQREPLNCIWGSRQ